MAEIGTERGIVRAHLASASTAAAVERMRTHPSGETAETATETEMVRSMVKERGIWRDTETEIGPESGTVGLAITTETGTGTGLTLPQPVGA